MRSPAESSQSLKVALVSCPPGCVLLFCGRTTSTYFQEMARDIQNYLRDQMPVWRERHPGVESCAWQ